MYTSPACSTDALDEKRKAIMTKDNKIAQLQAQVQTISAEKDTFTAKYEAIVKENEGENIVWYVKQHLSKQDLVPFLKN